MVEIKAVIFDYNGVVTALGKFDSLIVEYAKLCGVSQEVLEKVVREGWQLARVGAIDSMEFWRRIAEVVGYSTERLRMEWLARFPIRQEVLLIVGILRTKGYKTALLTNEIKDWMEEVIPAYSMQYCFDAIVTSYDVGVAKPDRQMFDAVMDRLGVHAKDCVFIDDQTKNTLAAEKLGFKVILFSTVEQMKEDLNNFGVKI